VSAQSEHARVGAIILVEDDEQLARLCTNWLSSERLALDTEFERSRTFFPRPGLIQITDGCSVFLIDPLSIGDFAPLLAVLGDHRLVKVLHACSEDLEVFHRLGPFSPSALFDTQLAGAFLGYGYLSYGRLVKALLDVDLAKDETRSNWLRRPLTPSQQNYAALDVAYLLPLQELLGEQLRQRGRELWFQEESARVLTRARPDTDPRSAFLRLRQASRLNRRELAVLRELCAWRELEARRRDCPRGFVLRDHVLLAIARTQPRRAPDLAAVEDIPGRELKRNGETIAQLVRTALRLPNSQLPEATEQASSWRRNAALARALRACVERKARGLGLPAQLLADRRTIADLVRSADSERAPSLPSQLHGWREGIIGEELLRMVSERHTSGKIDSG
jgi:ribonuclease D